MKTADWLDAVKQRLGGLEELVLAGRARRAEAAEYALLRAAYGAALGVELPYLLMVSDIADHLSETTGKPISAESVISMRNRNNPNRTAAEIAKAPSCPPPAMTVGLRKPIDIWVSPQLPQWDAWYESRPGQGKGGGRPPGKA
jgi:hypothetical protein